LADAGPVGREIEQDRPIGVIDVPTTG
jgi:hypothetical protein